MQVYGVDDRFWRFHGLTGGSDGGSAHRPIATFCSVPRSHVTSARRSGGTVLLRIQRPSDIPIDSLHGQKDDPGRTLRLTLRRVFSAAELGEFSLQPSRAMCGRRSFRCRGCRQDLDVQDRVNVILVASADAASRYGPAEAGHYTSRQLETLSQRMRIASRIVGLSGACPRDRRGVLSLETPRHA